MVNEKLSVIIPIYNVCDYLDKCIESVINQTYKNLEIILVDDGSKDQSGQICDRVAEYDSRIRVIHKENGGLVSARKAGLEVATGDYIGFVDGDDYIEPLFYEVLLNQIVKTNSDFVHTSLVEEKNGVEIKKYSCMEQIINNDLNSCVEIIRTSIFGESMDNIITQSVVTKLFRKELIRECYGNVPDDNSQGEDAICFVLCLLKAKTISVQTSPLYHCRKREGSYTDYTRVKNIEEIWRQYRELEKIFIKSNIYQYLQKDMDSFYLKFTLNIVKRIRPTCDVHIYYFKNVKILCGKRIVLYGAGAVGQDFYSQISKYVSCEIVAWIDKSYKSYKFDYRKVENADNIVDYQYDYIVIAVKSEQIAVDIKDWMQRKGVRLDKILWDKPLIIE